MLLGTSNDAPNRLRPDPNISPTLSPSGVIEKDLEPNRFAILSDSNPVCGARDGDLIGDLTGDLMGDRIGLVIISLLKSLLPSSKLKESNRAGGARSCKALLLLLLSPPRILDWIPRRSLDPSNSRA